MLYLQTGEMMSIPDSNTVIQVPVDDFVTMINNYCKVGTLCYAMVYFPIGPL